MKPLFIPLKTEYFEAFRAGTKTVEYRPYGTRWNEGTCPPGREVVLSRGYGTLHRLRGRIAGFEISEDITATELWRSIYGDKYGLAACIHVSISGDA